MKAEAIRLLIKYFVRFRSKMSTHLIDGGKCIKKYRKGFEDYIVEKCITYFRYKYSQFRDEYSNDITINEVPENLTYLDYFNVHKTNFPICHTQPNPFKNSFGYRK